MAGTYRLGCWVTADLVTICEAVHNIPSAEIISCCPLQELQTLIETDPEVYMLFTKMFREKFVPPHPNPIKDYKDMLQKMQYIINRSPEYNSMYGSAPLNHILIYVMATPSGTIAFLNNEVNKKFKAILDEWAVFLDSDKSQYALNTEYGWLCEQSLKTMPNFVQTYDCNPQLPYYGFKSWNDFFARKLRSIAVRPIASPDNPYVVTAPCEAVPYNLDKAPKFRDDFWIKSQPYSLQHLLNNEPSTESYVGGTVFQAFLNTANYHRWHVPVDGTITKAYIKQGAYYAEAASVGYDPTANTYSQRYLTHVDTRAIIMIDTKGYANVGTVVMVAVGMAEISSCEIDGSAINKIVKKGDSLGTFKFGGSTYCLLFEKGVKVTFTAQKDPSSTKRYPELNDELQLVNSHLATIQKS